VISIYFLADSYFPLWIYKAACQKDLSELSTSTYSTYFSSLCQSPKLQAAFAAISEILKLNYYESIVSIYLSLFKFYFQAIKPKDRIIVSPFSNRSNC
jgi:hypothetical protein